MEDILQRTGQGQSLRTDPRTLRSFDRDLAFYLQSGQSTAPTQEQTEKAFAAQTNVPANSPAVQGVISGPRADRIVTVARQLVGTLDSLYYRIPNEACASFVSTTLQRSGVFSDGTFTRAANELPTLVQSKGARLILSGSVDDRRLTEQAQPGDIVVLRSFPTKPYGHSGVCNGGERMISVTSRGAQGRISIYRIADAGWDLFTLYRFPQ